MLYRQIAAAMTMVLLLSSLLAPAAALAAADQGIAPGPAHKQAQENLPPTTGPRQNKARVAAETDPGGTTPAIYTVLLEELPVALYSGGIEGLAPTRPGLAPYARLDVMSADAQAYQGYLDSRQSAALNQISRTIGRSPEVVYSYQVVLNGFALRLSPREAAQVVTLPGVTSVIRDFMLQLDTDYGPEWIGAPSLWRGAAAPGGIGTQGEGVVVGVLDSGINMDHPSFADVGGDGYDHTNPRGKFYGVCDPESDVYNASFTCNDKLIGAWDFVDGEGEENNNEEDGPEDNDGHGSHTASTAAGNVVIGATASTDVFTYANNISGVAPHANIIAYDVCLPDGCPFSATNAGIEQATIDGVDVINYSIGSTPFDPWLSVELEGNEGAFLAASEAGVTVVTSAGNDGPSPFTAGSPGNAPWIMTVAASTHDRDASKMLMKLTGGATEPPADMRGKGLTIGYGPAPIVYAGDFGDELCLEPFAPGTFSGEIVVCDRGVNARVDKGANVLEGGAGGMVLANTSPGQSLNNDLHFLPAIHIPADEAAPLRAWLASGSGHEATIGAPTITVAPANGDIMAAFSSRGPNEPAPDIIKPDITAPGLDIFAAYRDPEDFSIISGTSMSSPHVAGAAALMSALYPEWSPDEIKSALMSTALYDGVRKEDGVTQADPFDYGAGRVDLTKAALAGFVLDESTQDFLAADPFYGGDPSTLNLASLGDSDCIALCSWTRTLTSTLDEDVTWTVSTAGDAGVSITVEPSSFTLAAGGTQEVTITADITGAELDRWLFGRVMFTPDSEATVEAHFPVAIYAAIATIADINIETRRNQGQVTREALSIALENPQATLYAAEPSFKELEIAQDPTNDDPYDLESGGVLWELVDVPATTKFFGVTTSESTAPDLDLFVGIDENGNGRPDPAEELCSSTSGTANESCALAAPLDAGTYWILVQNWDASDEDTDTFLLSISVIDETNTGAITAVVPDAVQGGVPYNVTIAWNIPTFKPGDVRFGLLELADAEGNPLTTASVRLTRLPDDVTLTASEEVVKAGDTLTYAINVQPETALAGDSVVYSFTATLPAGLSYVEGSAAIPPTSVQGNTIRWENVPISTLREYVQSNSTTNPGCDTGFGGYVDLEEFGIAADAALNGDSFVIDVDEIFGGEDPYFFYGEMYNAVYITADGFLTVNEDVGATPGENTALPNPALPNGLMAPFWRDLVVTYDKAANTGVSIAGAGGGALMIVEWDDVTPAGGGEGSYDFEVVFTREVDDTPDFYEIVFAYDNLTGSFSPATIGVENYEGTQAQQYAYDDAELEDGFQICYDWAVPIVTAAFQALVGDSFSGPATVTATLAHMLEAPGYGTATTSVATDVQAPTAIDDDAPDFVPGEDARIFLPMIIRN